MLRRGCLNEFLPKAVPDLEEPLALSGNPETQMHSGIWSRLEVYRKIWKRIRALMRLLKHSKSSKLSYYFAELEQCLDLQKIPGSARHLDLFPEGGDLLESGPG